jgi:hypothetical protein
VQIATLPQGPRCKARSIASLSHEVPSKCVRPWFAPALRARYSRPHNTPSGLTILFPFELRVSRRPLRLAEQLAWQPGAPLPRPDMRSRSTDCPSEKAFDRLPDRSFRAPPTVGRTAPSGYAGGLQIFQRLPPFSNAPPILRRNPKSTGIEFSGFPASRAPILRSVGVLLRPKAGVLSTNLRSLLTL